MSLLLAYYGDDFTGSTDVMEALQWAGLRTVLFLEPPTAADLARFADLRAFGVAGESRTMTPEEMDAALAPALDRLRASGAPLVHYKVCSTFDSSPGIGSIGRAIEIGRRLFGTRCVPVLAGAPVLGRFTVFGNQFARSGLDTEPFRLDRHPTMRHHPVTPMREADLRLHLGQQTSLDVALFDVLRLADSDPGARWDERLAHGPGAMVVDVLYPSHLPTIGQLISRGASPGTPLFVVGSSGVEYALAAHWERTGHLEGLRSHAPGRPEFNAVDQLLVMTGSCSPVNDSQIAWAEGHGFVSVPLDVARLVRPDTREAEIGASIERGLAPLVRGASVILHSSRGPDDPRVEETRRALARVGSSGADGPLQGGRTIGPILGRILAGLLARARLRRVVVTGGDTSGSVARALGVEALEAIAEAAPGSPLCRIHTADALDGLEVVFKGGQVGRTDIYGTIRNGTAAT
jgi:3-oxoisoapionate kinase